MKAKKKDELKIEFPEWKLDLPAWNLGIDWNLKLLDMEFGSSKMGKQRFRKRRGNNIVFGNHKKKL